MLLPTGQTFSGGIGDAYENDPPVVPGLVWKPRGANQWDAYARVPAAKRPAAPAAPSAPAPSHAAAAAPVPSFGGDLPELFQPDKFPRSDAYSGLAVPYREKIEQGIIPELVARAKALPETIDRYTQNAARLYERQSRQALEGSLPGLLARLGRRGMLNSSVAADAISELGARLVPTFANRAYDAGMTAAKMQAGVPGVLTAIANLARYSKTHYENPLAPYQMLSNFVMNF